MRASQLAPLILLVFVSCEPSGLLSAKDLNGTWNWQWNGNPGGSGISLSLSAAGTTIRGSGTICGVGPAACAPGPVTIVGHGNALRFQLSIQGDSGYVVTYTGQLIGHDELSGTWTQGTASNTFIFYRL